VIDWNDVASFATAGGTLILAVATFASIRSANQAARTAERALLVNLRPVLVPSRPQDAPLKVGWYDEHWASVPGGHATVELVDDKIYLAMSLRNVGSGLAVLHGWWPAGTWNRADVDHADLDSFRMQSRDMYVPAGDSSFWQAAIREPSDPDYDGIAAAITRRERFNVELLYGDHDGGQRTVTLFGVIPRADGDETNWICSVVRHWNIDRPDPR
jgi:hypothetical protein